MLSSCKNTGWERSKCLRHPQPCSELGPVRRPPGAPGPSAALGGGWGRMGVRAAWGWESVACFALVFPLDSSLSVGLDSAPARGERGDGDEPLEEENFGGLQPWVGGEGP